jgi:hypothetical protein
MTPSFEQNGTDYKPAAGGGDKFIFRRVKPFSRQRFSACAARAACRHFGQASGSEREPGMTAARHAPLKTKPHRRGPAGFESNK